MWRSREGHYKCTGNATHRSYICQIGRRTLTANLVGARPVRTKVHTFNRHISSDERLPRRKLNKGSISSNSNFYANAGVRG
jgi:hypothetical protein